MGDTQVAPTGTDPAVAGEESKGREALTGGGEPVQGMEVGEGNDQGPDGADPDAPASRLDGPAQAADAENPPELGPEAVPESAREAEASEPPLASDVGKATSEPRGANGPQNRGKDSAMYEEPEDVRSVDEVVLSLRSMWELPASWRLLHLFSIAGLNIPEIGPADLERFLVSAEQFITELEEIHARILGLGPASFNRWINKTKAVARSNHDYFYFLFSQRVGLARSSNGMYSGFEEVDDGLVLKDLRSYVHLEPEIRCRTLHALLERQFSELEGRVGDEARALEPTMLRLAPVGYDSDLTSYWYFGDLSRLYREPDLEYQRRKAEKKIKESQKHKVPEEREKRKRAPSRAVPSPEPYSKRMRTRRRTRASMASENADEDNDMSEEELPAEAEELPTEEDVNGPSKEPQEGENAEKQPCTSWELVAVGSDGLREFCDTLVNNRNASERALVNRLKNELYVEWEDAERKAIKEEMKKKEIVVAPPPPNLHKRSARIHALERKREEERKGEPMVLVDRDLEEERYHKRAELMRAEKERNRELKTLRRARSMAGVHPTAASSRPQRESSRRTHNYRDGGEPNFAQLEAQFSVRNERIMTEAQIDNIDDYTHFYEDKVPNRVLDRFRFLGPRGESTKLEHLDRNPDLAVSAEGVLIPPDWSEVLPQMVEVSRVTEWCIDYGEDPSLWIKSEGGAWYRLERPAHDYRWAFGSTRRKFEISARLYILAAEFSEEDLTFRNVVDWLGQQYYTMRPNRESEILDVGPFILSQVDSVQMKNLVNSEFIARLRSHALEKGLTSRKSGQERGSTAEGSRSALAPGEPKADGSAADAAVPAERAETDCADAGGSAAEKEAERTDDRQQDDESAQQREGQQANMAAAVAENGKEAEGMDDRQQDEESAQKLEGQQANPAAVVAEDGKDAEATEDRQQYEEGAHQPESQQANTAALVENEVDRTNGPEVPNPGQIGHGSSAAAAEEREGRVRLETDGDHEAAVGTSSSGTPQKSASAERQAVPRDGESAKSAVEAASSVEASGDPVE